MKFGHGAMDLKRKDTPENRAFWESVEKAKDDWQRTKPDWAKSTEERREDLFLALVYLATDQGVRAIDMPRKDIAVAFFIAFQASVDYPAIMRRGLEYFKGPFVDWVEVNQVLSHALTGVHRGNPELWNDLYHLLKFRRRKYIGAPESEVGYESDFEEHLKDLNKTRSLNFAMSVKDAKAAEAILGRLSDEEKEILRKIASNAARGLTLV